MMGELPMIEISWGELFDRVTILELKAQHCRNEADAAVIRSELEMQRAALAPISKVDLGALPDDLRDINASLWAVEDALRVDEDAGRFDADFIARARSVYKLNDQRAALKRAINDKTGAAFYEVKIYTTAP